MKKNKDKGSQLKFQDYSYEDADKDESQLSKGSYGKLKSGINNLRILPAREGEDWKLVFYKHFVPVPGQEKKAIFICPFHQTRGKRTCATCKKVKKLQASGSKADLAAAKTIEAQKKIKVNAVDRDDEEAGVKEYELSPGVYRDLIEIRKVDGVNFTHPTEGCDITIKKSGEGRLKTRYVTKAARETTPLHKSRKVMAQWIEEQGELKVIIDSDEDIEAKLRGEDPRDRDDDRRGSKRRKSRDDDDDDDMDDDDLDDQDDDDDEDDRRKSKKSKKRSRDEDEEEEDDEDEDEDDEEISF